VVWLLAVIGLSGAAPTVPASASVAQIPKALVLEPIHRSKDRNGMERFTSASNLEFEKVQPGEAVFLAICTNEWPAGLVPIFAVEKTNRIELRRRPELGMEGSSEPIFFALPPEDEPEAAKLAGRWECRAIRGNGSKDYLIWELAIEGEIIAGRFDPNTEYRVATIAGGTFRSNLFELRVEYFRDSYVLTGVWHDGRLSGEWRHTDDSERGSWEATRELYQSSGGRGFVEVPLYEWRRTVDDARRYAVAGEKLTPEWQRAGRPLCRVWRQKPRGRE